MKLCKPICIALGILFAVWMSAAPAAAARVKVDVWAQRGETRLRYAAGYDKPPAVVTAPTKTGVSASVRNGHGKIPLYFAMKSYRRNHANENALIEFLGRAQSLSLGNPKWAKSCKGWNTSGFFEFAEPADVSRCLKTKSPNTRNKRGKTPLHFTARYIKNPMVITLLVKSGADPNVRDEKGETPLHVAARRGYGKSPALIALLIKGGAEPNARNDTGETPLHVVARRNHDVYNVNTAVITALLKGGADPDARDKLGSTSLHLAVLYSPTFTTLPTVEALLSVGADASVRNKKGKTPLELAMRYHGKTSAVANALKETLKRARRRRAEDRQRAKSCERWNTVAYFEHADATDVSRCLETKNPNARNKDGEAPLHLAAWLSETPAVVEVLLDGGASPTASTIHGLTPWDYAEENSFLTGTKALLRLKEAKGK